jgi:hypothetical protein
MPGLWSRIPFGIFMQAPPLLPLLPSNEALDWLAQLVTHIPNKGEQMVRYYGYYSKKSRGMRKKAGTDDQVPALVESAVSSAAFKGLFNGAIPSSGHTIMLRLKFAGSGYHKVNILWARVKTTGIARPFVL